MRSELSLVGKEKRIELLRGLGCTPKQAECAAHLMDGHTTDKIAELLCITTNTVRFHLGVVYKRLKVKSRYQCILKLNELGII